MNEIISNDSNSGILSSEQAREAVTKLGDGVIGEILLTENGAVIIGNPSEETFDLSIAEAARAGVCIKFNLGDLMNASAEKYGGEKYDRWVRLTGMNQGTLRNIASTCRRVPQEIRRAGLLSFEHHVEVAKLDHDGQVKWLDAAADKGLSKDRLRESVSRGKVVSDKQSNSAARGRREGGFPNIESHLTAVTVMFGAMRRDGVLDDIDEGGLRDLHDSLMPLTEAHGMIVDMIEKRFGLPEGDRINDDLYEVGLVRL